MTLSCCWRDSLLAIKLIDCLKVVEVWVVYHLGFAKPLILVYIGRKVHLRWPRDLLRAFPCRNWQGYFSTLTATIIILGVVFLAWIHRRQVAIELFVAEIVDLEVLRKLFLLETYTACLTRRLLVV